MLNFILMCQRILENYEQIAVLEENQTFFSLQHEIGAVFRFDLNSTKFYEIYLPSGLNP